jgi:F-type H+-transporting ATPase subunit gamma
MAKTRDIKRRIRSVKSTQQITRTMEMVATSKLKRAQDRLQASRPYGGEVKKFIRELVASKPSMSHPLLEEREEVRSVGLLLVTSNRGLCGSFNTNIIKRAHALYEELGAEGKTVTLDIVGKKGLSFFRFREFPIERSFTGLPELPSPDDIGELADSFIDRYTSGAIDRFVILYNEFRSPVEQRPIIETVIPIPRKDVDEEPGEYIMEPVPEEILARILPLYVHSTLRMALTESTTSEQGARRTAMKAATDNADEMIRFLVRSFNKARQAQITQEISEIVGGANALSE